MNKTLIAAAALCCAGVASAQSSVTIFGTVDVALTRGIGSVSSRTQVASGAMNASKIGFMGAEDLGGGMSATFWLEAGMNVDEGIGGATNSNNQPSGTGAPTAGRQGLTFNRKSTVGLSGPWGDLRLGRDYTPQYGIQFAYDPLGNNGVGTTQSVSSSIIGPTQFRASNAITYATPSGLGGFSALVQHYRGENPSNAANSDDGTGAGVRLNYATATWSVSAATGRVAQATGDVRQSNLGGQYAIGPFKLMGYATRDRNGPVRAKGYLLGGLMAAGPGEIRASYSTYETDVAAHPKIQKLATGYVYNFSKRTALYTTVAFVRNSRGATFAPAGGVTAANQSAKGMDVGLRHSF
jgi:predicted porin